jgi:hypothetical protein
METPLRIYRDARRGMADSVPIAITVSGEGPSPKFPLMIVAIAAVAITGLGLLAYVSRKKS